MSKQGKREYINMIKRKLTSLDDINEDILNEIIDNVRVLLKFKTDEETTVISKKGKKPGVKKTKDISDTPKEIKKKLDFVISEGNFMVDFSME